MSKNELTIDITVRVEKTNTVTHTHTHTEEKIDVLLKYVDNRTKGYSTEL